MFGGGWIRNLKFRIMFGKEMEILREVGIMKEVGILLILSFILYFFATAMLWVLVGIDNHKHKKCLSRGFTKYKLGYCINEATDLTQGEAYITSENGIFEPMTSKISCISFSIFRSHRFKYSIFTSSGIVTGKQIGRASCRERVSSPV